MRFTCFSVDFAKILSNVADIIFNPLIHIKSKGRLTTYTILYSFYNLQIFKAFYFYKFY